ncbi:unnamed protein product [Ceutorhynchus assimilis]|uniref:Myb/SANT-like DNA-binding domain-containing protein n=1 Tax=Ceutorhynchus assimilis TaxID=467358 RepID=A0A9N9QNQ9_9CUCU|nr:unnamed protein product [Ceutorhynchus assimilis]
MNEDLEMVDFHLGNFVINIDSKMARNLCEDPELARRYIDELRRQCPEAEAGTSTSTSSVLVPSVAAASQPVHNQKSEQKVWTTSKGQTPRDLQATAFFLCLRKDLDKKFKDKKTANTTLWQEVAEKMNRNGYFVGYGSDGRERCRQKFANLQQTYLKYIDRRRQTGEDTLDGIDVEENPEDNIKSVFPLVGYPANSHLSVSTSSQLIKASELMEGFESSN